MVSLSRAYGDDFTDRLSATGLQDTQAVSDKCIADFAGAYPGLHVADLLKPGVDFLAEPDVKQIVSGLVMGRGHTPTAPMLMVQGNSDGTGDGVMVAADVKALATTYCRAGLAVQYHELAGKAHSAAGTLFVLQGLGFLAERFAGTAAPSDCAALTATTAPPTPTRVHATLAGRSQGVRDVLTVTAPGATGAAVRLYRAGTFRAIARGVVGADGRATLRVRDRNGRAISRYRALVGATPSSTASTTAVRRLR
jgi:hypothetical protein